jgi:tripartite-type tricarboxylate transporter receptor subunit TctC
MRLNLVRHAALVGLVAFAWSMAPAVAEKWPNHSIILVVPFGVGSASDTVSRILVPSLSQTLGQQIVVQNMGGAGGTIGTGHAAKAPPDGYTVVLGAVDTFAQSQSLFKKPPYNSIKDFTPAGLAVEQPLLLLVRKDLPVDNLKQFAAYTKAHHAQMQFGSAGVGSAAHLACFQFTKAVGVSVTHVPYRSSAPALQDLIAGRLDFYCPLAVAGIPLMQSKSAKALAVLTQQRSPLLPDLPTAKEQGYSHIDGYYWMGFFFPKGTASSIINKFNAALNVALNSSDVQMRLRKLATTVVAPDRRSPTYLRNYLKDEVRKWAVIMKESGVVPR